MIMGEEALKENALNDIELTYVNGGQADNEGHHTVPITPDGESNAYANL